MTKNIRVFVATKTFRAILKKNIRVFVARIITATNSRMKYEYSCIRGDFNKALSCMSTEEWLNKIEKKELKLQR